MNNIADKKLFIKMAERYLYGVKVSETFEDFIKYAIGLQEYIQNSIEESILNKKEEEKYFKKFIKKEVLG